MKVPFAALGLLLLSAAQALPLPKTGKTASIPKSLHKRKMYSLWDGIPQAAKFDDIIMAVAFDLGRKAFPHPKMPVSNWHDKENNRFESNSWALSPHELRILDEVVGQTNQPATVGKGFDVVF